MLHRRPVENETAVGLLNRMGLFSRGVFRSPIDNGTDLEAIECLGDRHSMSLHPSAVIVSVITWSA